MKKVVRISLLLIVLISSFTGCTKSTTEVTFADFKCSYDPNTKICTITNIDDRDLYGITLGCTATKTDGSTESYEVKIANLIVGEEYSFEFMGENISKVTLNSVTANTDPNWEKEEIERNNGWKIVGTIVVVFVIIFFIGTIIFA